MAKQFKVIAEGKYACFSRPELREERVSYDIPTVSALEGMLKNIYWKPAMRYVIDKIIVFNPFQYITMMKNEIKVKPTTSGVWRRMKNPTTDIRIYTDEKRRQNQTQYLKNVKYGIEFHIELTGIRSDRERQECCPIIKHQEILKRRLLSGEDFHGIPYLGLSECLVEKIYMVDEFDLTQIHKEIRAEKNKDMGYMLYRVHFLDNGIPVNNDWEHKVFSDKMKALYYRPYMQGGVIDVKKYARDVKW